MVIFAQGSIISLSKEQQTFSVQIWAPISTHWDMYFTSLPRLDEEAFDLVLIPSQNNLGHRQLNKQIARNRNLQPRTITNHWNRILAYQIPSRKRCHPHREFLYSVPIPICVPIPKSLFLYLVLHLYIDGSGQEVPYIVSNNCNTKDTGILDVLSYPRYHFRIYR